jgi:Flp pilus assembly protein TadG
MKTKRVYRGYSLIVTAMFGLTLFGLMGLATDTSWVYLTAHQLQNTADAAALAGAEGLSTGNATAQSQAYVVAAANQAGNASVLLNPNANNAASGDVVLGTWNASTSTFTPTLTNPDAVQVVASRTSTSLSGALPLFFGPAFGVPTSNVSRSAIAYMPNNTAGPGILLLGGTLSLNEADIDITNGTVVVNSTSPDAVQLTSDSSITATALDIAGGYTEDGDSSLSGTTVNTGVTPTPDPLAGLSAPSTSSLTTYNSFTGNTLQPGYYPNGIDLSSNQNITLEPGEYVVGGSGLIVPAGSSITEDPSNPGGTVIVVNQGTTDLEGTVNLTPQTSGTYANVAIFQPSSNNSPATINGDSTGANISISGTLYFPGAPLSISGTNALPGDQIISDGLSLSGSSQSSSGSSSGSGGSMVGGCTNMGSSGSSGGNSTTPATLSDKFRFGSSVEGAYLVQ